MKIYSLLFFCFFTILLVAQASPLLAKDMTSGLIQDGSLLLYTQPQTKKTVTLLNPKQAYQDLLQLTKKVTTSLLQSIPGPKDGWKSALTAKYQGWFLRASMQDKNLWYISPLDAKKYYFDGTQTSFTFLKTKAFIAQSIEPPIKSLPAEDQVPTPVMLLPKQAKENVLPPPTAPAPAPSQDSLIQVPHLPAPSQPPVIITPPPIVQPLPNQSTSSLPAVVPADCGATSRTIAADTTYLIITRPIFGVVLAPFVAAKQFAGERVQVVYVDDIICTDVGADVPAKVRAYLQRAKATSTVKYLLIMGAPRRIEDRYAPGGSRTANLTLLQEPWEVPMKYVFTLLPEWTRVKTPTDQYYATLSEVWGDDEQTDWIRSFGFHTDLLVGRIPARTTEEATAWINKTLAWRTPQGHFIESRFKTSRCPYGRPAYDENFANEYNHDLRWHVCQSDDGGDIASISNNDAPDLITSASHGWVGGISKFLEPKGYDYSLASPGLRKPPIMFVHGCEVGGLDYTERSLGEKLMMSSDGVVAFIGSTRSHFDQVFPFRESFFQDGHFGLGEAFYAAKERVMREALPGEHLLDNLFMFNLMGDPSLIMLQFPGINIRSADAGINYLPMTTTTAIADPLLFSFDVQSTLSTPISLTRIETIAAIDGAGPDTILPGATIRVGSSIDPIFLRNQSLPLFIESRLRGCDVSRMTCISPTVVVAPSTYLSCARLRIDASGQKHADVKLMNAQRGSFRLRLKESPGGYSMSAATQLDELSLANPTANSVFTFSFRSTPTSIPFSVTSTSVYYKPLFTAELVDATTNTVVGSCSYNTWTEPDIERVLP